MSTLDPEATLGMLQHHDPILSPRSADELAVALRDARNYTLQLYRHLSEAQQAFPCVDGVNLPRWEVGHVGWFQEYWCLRHRAENRDPLPSRLGGSDALWDSSNVPHVRRWTLPVPSWEEIFAYLERTLEDTLERLDRSADGDRYFYELALYHEDMHGEAMLMTLQALRLPAPAHIGRSQAPFAAGMSWQTRGDVTLPGGEFELGSHSAAADKRFVFDNEKSAHTVLMAPFSIARRCVTNAEFLEFVADGGYRRPELWSEAGRSWLAQASPEAPAYWRPENQSGGEWRDRYFDSHVELHSEHPVQHVNWFEADAWCRWAGRRLPTEAEWERAARHGLASNADDRAWPTAKGHANLDASLGAPASAGAFGKSSSTGIVQMLGNVWEWTSSPFEPYPDFSPDPYTDYSVPWFTTHYVLRGGSWATRARLVHNRFRNFYLPARCDPFVGFRTCAPLA